MDKKYFFFDIDGTLTDIKTGIPVPSALETIKKYFLCMLLPLPTSICRYLIKCFCNKSD